MNFAQRVPQIVIAGAGVAGLEALLALRALAGERAEVTIVAPETKFLNRSLATRQPFGRRRVRGVPLEAAARELGARWEHDTVDRVELGERVVVTRERRRRVPYDFLVLALGARVTGCWPSERVLTYRDGRDAAAYRLLLGGLHRGHVRHLAFVKPAATTWPLPLYGLALMTAAECAAHGLPTEVSLVTPEEEPLAVFGPNVSDAVRALLDEHQVELHTRSYAAPGRHRTLTLAPHHRSIPADAIVTVPRLVGPRLRGIPCGPDGFLQTDSNGAVLGCPRVYAAGDATTFPVKQGTLAAQQADAVAASIAGAIGAPVDPQPFEPILRGVLLTGDEPRYLQADISGRGGDEPAISTEPLWHPANKLCARYLGPYLSAREGEELDVMAPAQAAA